MRARMLMPVLLLVLLTACGGGGGEGSDSDSDSGSGGDDTTTPNEAASIDFTSSESTDVAEGVTETTYRAKARSNGDSNLVYELSGGTDRAHFELDGKGFLHVRQEAGFDFEAPLDADADNTYELEVTATDGEGTKKTQPLRVRVTDLPEFLDESIEAVKMGQTETGGLIKPRTVRIAWRPDESLAEAVDTFRILLSMSGGERNYKLVEDAASGPVTEGEDGWFYQDIERPLHRLKWSEEQVRVDALAGDGSVIASSSALLMGTVDSTAMIGYPRNPRPAERHGLGESVTVSGNGNVIAVATRALVDGWDGARCPSVTGGSILKVHVSIWRNSSNGWQLDTGAPLEFEMPHCLDHLASAYKPVSLSLSDDGGTLAVGLPQAFNENSVCRGGTWAGMVRIYAHDYGSLGGEGGDGEPLEGRSGWTLVEGVYSTLPGEKAYFGTDVALSGDGSVLVVGEPGADGLPGDRCDSAHDNTGNVYVYQRELTEGEPNRDTWDDGRILWPSETAREPRGDNAYRGLRVATNMDGSLIALTQGSNGHVLTSGTPPKPEIQLYERVFAGGGWDYMDYWANPVDSDSDGDFPITDVALLSVPGDNAGHWVALGAPEDDHGCSGVHLLSNVECPEINVDSGSIYLTSIANTGADGVDAEFSTSGIYQVKEGYVRAGARFGQAVDLVAPNGGASLMLAGGAPGAGGEKAGIVTNVWDPDVSGYESAGSVHVYAGDGGRLSDLRLRNRLKASNPQSEDESRQASPQFGYSLALSRDGNALVVGAPGSDALSGPDGSMLWGLEDTDGIDDAGAAYLY